MNKDFAEWYRAVDIEPNHERLQNRWLGIESYCSRVIGCTEILNLVRLFLNLTISDDFKDNLIKAFFESDNAFPQKDNDNELSVLAGAILVHISDKNISKLKNFALLAIAAASFKRKAVVPSILTLLKSYLNDSMFNIRDVKSIDPVSIITPPVKGLKDSLKAIEETKTWTPPDELAKQFSSYLTSINKSIIQINSEIDKSLYLQRIYREDSQILWWLSGGFSTDIHKPISELNNAESCIVAGKELADIVEILPGPYSAKAVLNKTFSNLPEDSKEITFSKAVNKTNKEWRQQILKKYEIEKTKDITPILAAIYESLRVEKAGEWLAAHKQLTGISAKDTKLSIDELAYQVYTECLLLKAYVN